MALRHKHLKIDQRKLDRAKQLLKMPTEQATIDRALDGVLADELIVKTHKKPHKRPEMRARLWFCRGAEMHHALRS